ncbi:hypothetical protein [Paenibacillus puerhi]|uniref:hypothetical protein n=1 Tax=Paenibacillus puerhi TaxID=2692622 RepID=UPI001359D75F|nr:hypothetical protein [Paenibacillus puerhi]
MEKTLVKGAVYSFLIGLLLGLVIFPDPDSSTVRWIWGFSIHVTNDKQYIIQLLRFASFISLVTLAVIWLKSRFVITDKKTGLGEFIKGMIVSFLVVLLIIVIVSMLISVFV